MATLAKDLVRALDPVAFARESLGFAPDPWQADALRWTGRRLMLNCARQSGKSTIAAILALHRAIYCPGSLVLLVSPSLRQSGELFRKVTELLELLDEKPALTEDNKLSLRLTSGSRVVSLPAKEGTVRGFSGVDLIVEDEASRVSDDLYWALRPMLAVSRGRLILMSTPFGKRGHFFKEWTDGGGMWERVEVKATECPRISPEFLEEELASLGDWWYKQEYLCEFVESIDAVFSFDYVMAAIATDVTPLFAGANVG